MRGCKRRSNQIARHKRRATSLKDVRYAQCPKSGHFLKFGWFRFDLSGMKLSSPARLGSCCGSLVICKKVSLL